MEGVLGTPRTWSISDSADRICLMDIGQLLSRLCLGFMNGQAGSCPHSAFNLQSVITLLPEEQ